MRLFYLFASFLLGVFVSDPSYSAHLIWPEPILILLGLAAMLSCPVRSVRSLIYLCMAFMIGAVWITWLPTWPTPLADASESPPPKFAIRGRAAGEAFETASGVFLPIILSDTRQAGLDESDSAPDQPWTPTRGVLLAEIPREFDATQGALYSIQGTLATSPELLRAPIALRYRPRAIVLPSDIRDIHQLADPPPLALAENALRYRLASHLSWGMGETEGELVSGIVLGRKGRHLSGDWTKSFYAAGLSHLIVASGAQLSLLFMPFFFLLARVRLIPWAKWTLLVTLGCLLIGFAHLLGGEPSILRASAMGCILLLSTGLGRRGFGLATLSAAGFYWLIQNPTLSRDASFMLSLGSSFGITYFAPPLIEKWTTGASLPSSFASRNPIDFLVVAVRHALRFLVTCAITTCSAQLGVLPVLVSMMGRFSFAGFGANLFAVPIGEFVLLLGALSGLGGFAHPFVSITINRLLGHLATMLVVVARDFANTPLANRPIDPVPGWVAAAYYATLILGAEAWRAYKFHRLMLAHRPKKT